MTETSVQKLKLLCRFEMYHQLPNHLWFNLLVIPERNGKEKKNHKKGTANYFIFIFLFDANGWLKSLVLIKNTQHNQSFFFFFNTFSNVGKCLMLLKSRKRTFWIQQKEGSQVFRVLGEPAPLNLCIRFYLVLTPYCGFLCSFFPDFFFVWKSS